MCNPVPCALPSSSTSIILWPGVQRLLSPLNSLRAVFLWAVVAPSFILPFTYVAPGAPFSVVHVPSTQPGAPVVCVSPVPSSPGLFLAVSSRLVLWTLSLDSPKCTTIARVINDHGRNISFTTACAIPLCLASREAGLREAYAEVRGAFEVALRAIRSSGRSCCKSF